MEDKHLFYKAGIYKKIFVFLCLLLVCLFFFRLFYMREIKSNYKNGNYDKAIEMSHNVLYFNENNDEALRIYLLSVKNANDQNVPITSYSPQYISFGHYEQDGNYENGKESVEWQVIYEDYDKYLIISRYILDCIPYHNEMYQEVTWEDCDLRRWLNNDFIFETFSSEEIERILTTKNINCNNVFFVDTIGGHKTDDKIFCLSMMDIFKYYQLRNIETSIEENKYFDIQSDLLVAELTDYALIRGALYDDSHSNMINTNNESYINMNIYGKWYLRTPGAYNFLVCIVGNEGEVDVTIPISAKGIGIRPAMYIKK